MVLLVESTYQSSSIFLNKIYFVATHPMLPTSCCHVAFT
jgi:hypothetical protein